MERTIGGQRDPFELKDDRRYTDRKNCGKIDKGVTWQ